MPVRFATRADIPVMATILAAAFGPDRLFQVLFPHQRQYPEAFTRALEENLWLAWYDYKKSLVVSYVAHPELPGRQASTPDERDALLPKLRVKKETLTGIAEWERLGKGWEHVNGAWGWWDPRLMMKPLLSTFYKIRRRIFPNRASARPTPENPDPMTLWNFLPRILPFVAPFFSAPHRQVHWSLEVLAVHPAFQGQGYGRELVEQGLARAKCDPEGDLPACVVAADGKETFYQKVGYHELVGWGSRTKDENGEDNPLRKNGVGGGAVLWTR